MASTKTTTSSICPRDQLRELLRCWEPAAGPEGFEGLVARALATFTGLTFRLARSGSQFGRDGATPSGPFSIAMEAKRYSQSVPLQELAGKATLAAHALADDIDVWGLAATVEIGETTQRLLEGILEKSGIHLLTLDWAEAELPMLAVLLAGAGDPLVDWAEKRIGAADHLILKAGLDDVRGDAGYDAALAELRSRLTSSTLGLDSLSQSSSHWGQRHFSDRQLRRACCNETFGNSPSDSFRSIPHAL